MISTLGVDVLFSCTDSKKSVWIAKVMGINSDVVNVKYYHHSGAETHETRSLKDLEEKLRVKEYYINGKCHN